MRKFTIIVLVVVALFSGCKRADQKAQTTANPMGNILGNPGFEEGAVSWKWLDWSESWGPFDISDKIAHSGKKSAMLKIDATAQNPGKKIHGVVQSLIPQSFPRKAGGWYRVEKWNRGATRQYMQFVVIAWEQYKAKPDKTYPNFQLRYVLEGTAAQPLQIANAKYTILTKAENPKVGEWIHFEVNIRDDYMKYWGKVPDKFERLDFFWEARFDEAPKDNAHIEEEVYFDDLYVGE